MVTTDPDTGISTAAPDGPDTWVLRYDKQGGTVLELYPLIGTCQSPNPLFTGTQSACVAQAVTLALTGMPAFALPANWKAQAAAMVTLTQPLMPANGLAALEIALTNCDSIPDQFFATLRLVYGLGITQAQIDAAVAGG